MAQHLVPVPHAWIRLRASWTAPFVGAAIVCGGYDELEGVVKKWMGFREGGR